MSSTFDGALILSNGSIYKGHLFGDKTSAKETLGEVVFQTGMVGYCESLTDPSYNRQILVLTYPLIGNYGVPAAEKDAEQRFESDRIWAAGLICGELSKQYSHWEATKTLDAWLAEHKRPGLYGIDTRKLTKELRENGTLVGKIIVLDDNEDYNDDDARNQDDDREADATFALPDTPTGDRKLILMAKELAESDEYRNYPQNLNLVDEVSPKIEKVSMRDNVEFPRITLVDCGAKNNIERCLLDRGVRVHRVPWNYDLVSNINSYDGIMLSNGPGDPQKCQCLIEQLRQLFSMEDFRKPIFGICLGHQLMGLAAGFQTYKLPFGNRGHNQPCRLVGSKRCLITSQNHGFALETHKNVPSDVSDNWFELFVNENDNSNEGIAHKSKPFFSVQFHPEHNAGPRDTEFLFDIFIKSVINYIEGTNGFNQITAIREHLNQNQTPKPEGIKKVLILGSGGLSIGQAGEFDYSGSQAIKALKSENIFTILINPNIATVQTSPTLVDRVYLLPVTAHYVTEVIKRERPDGLMLMFGGQTALNCGLDLEDSGVLRQYDVQVLGPSIESIRNSEDRKLFCKVMAEIDVKVAPSCAVTSVEEAVDAAKILGYPILVRAAFALGGLGSGFAHNECELRDQVGRALVNSPQALLDKSLKGWKELEYEVVRDIYDNCATICNMENVDPLGIHTGESIVVAPSQTLNDYEYNILREVAIKIVRHLGIIGECNVQYAVNPKTSKELRTEADFYVIEINPRLSRSSALASKATGYPLAYIAAKLALGKSLTDLNNTVTSSNTVKTTACFEPSLDYCVVKVPRWDLSKFTGVTHEIGSSMKSIGEVMAIGRSFEEAFQKALRMVGDCSNGFDAYTKCKGEELSLDEIETGLRVPTDKRIFVLAAAMDLDLPTDRLYELTGIDPWFLHKMRNIVDIKNELRTIKLPEYDLHSNHFRELLLRAKQAGFSDKQIGVLIDSNELKIRMARCDKHKILPSIKQVDTVAAEWPARTNYLYLTYCGSENDIALPDQSASRFTTRTQSVSLSQSPSPVKPPKPPSKLAEKIALANNMAAKYDEKVVTSSSVSQQVLVLGSGVYRIGSSVEFDCCAVGCVQELRRMGKHVIMLNYNPETVSTDYDECEKLYFDEISFETVMDIYHLEQPQGIILSMGGQTPNNIAMQLYHQRVTILGTKPENIDGAEDRYKFSRMLDNLEIKQPRWKESTDKDKAYEFCEEVGYPCIVRPSYVLSGAAMNVAHTDEDLKKFLDQAAEVSKEHPVVISKFIEGAKEIDVDAVAQDGRLVCMAVSEHVENAGVHSGDATLVTPPQNLNDTTLIEIDKIVSKIAESLLVNGPFNIQLLLVESKEHHELMVIECNLRASRSFPFVSKTLNYDFIATATKVIMGQEVKRIDDEFSQLQPKSNYTMMAQRSKRVGVKVPQFSFSRLSGADIKLGVEMASTGEVACFGDNKFSAYLKALISTGFRLPERKIVLISIADKWKEEFIPSMITLAKMGYKIYATQGTADYYHAKLSEELKNQLFWIDWPPSDEPTSHDEIDAIVAYLSAKEFDLVINLPKRTDGARRVPTLGYRTRRFAIDHSVPLISDIKCARLLIEAIEMFEGKQPLVNDLDCLTSANIITLPGLIDVHVHVRDFGEARKEDFDTATAAALAGGITFIGVMPNTDPPITDLDTFKQEQELARGRARCDYGLIVGATSTNAEKLAVMALSEPVLSLKMYLNTTHGQLCLPRMSDWQEHFERWPESIPICVHAEGKTAAAVILFAHKYNKRVHICHISSEEEILLVRHAKSMGIKVTCEVAPHHLFLSEEDCRDGALLGPLRGSVKPPLMSLKDQAALWDNLDAIDCFATDHAPHLLEEKEDKSPPGFPGLETMLPLLLDATTSKDQKRRLTIQQIVDMLYTNPKRIFNIPDQPDTSVEVDMSRCWRIGHDQTIFSKSKWTPFYGRQVRGKVVKVTLRGQVAFVGDKLLAAPGTGRDILAQRDYASTSLQQLQQLQLQEAERPMPEPVVPLVQPLASVTTQSQPELLLDTRLQGSHVLTIEQFDRNLLKSLFNLAERYYKADHHKQPIEPVMAGKVMGTLFFEASTRTEWSFASAMMKLGGHEKKFDQACSSFKKGETLDDTMKILSSYCDVIVLRHPVPGAVKRAAEVSAAPVINAGDGTGEHPTQALLDIFTIRKEIGTVSNLNIALVGDLKNGRTVHSLAKLLTLYEIGELRLVAPKGLELPKDIIQYLRERKVNYKSYDSLEDIVKDSDVIYMTRIQRERFQSDEEYQECAGKLKITQHLIDQNKLDKMRVMHPLPRVDEIDPAVDDDPRAAYFRQAHYGLYVRMALLTLIKP